MGLTLAQTTEIAASAKATSKSLSAGKGRGAAKGKARLVKLPTERKHKAGNGLSVLVKGRKGFGLLATVEALADALASFRASLEAEQGGEARDEKSGIQEAA